jgi:ATP-dependent Lon protease
MTDQDHQLPLLPLRDVVVYPHMVLPLFVGRERSYRGPGARDARQQAGAAGGSA